MPVAFRLVFIAAAGGGQAGPIAVSIADEARSQTSSAFIQYLGRVDAIDLNEPIYSGRSQAQEDLDNGKIWTALAVTLLEDLAKTGGDVP